MFSFFFFLSSCLMNGYAFFALFCLLIVQRLVGWFVDTWREFGIPFWFLVT